MHPRMRELHNIMAIANIPTVIKYGILSHNAVQRRGVGNIDISMQAIQDRRRFKTVPQGLALHEYANLYFDAHNPMMSKLRAQVNDICVLRVSTDILQLTDVVISDSNCASGYVLFLMPSELERLNFDDIYAINWTDPHYPTACRKKSRKCAEVLVPNCIPYMYIQGAYVGNVIAEQNLKTAGFNKTIHLNPNLFFQ